MDPNSPVIAAALGFVHYNAREYEKAIQLLLEAARELRSSAVLQDMLSWCYLQIGNRQAAIESARRAVELSNRSSSALCALAHAEAASGNRAAAAALVEEIERIAQQRYLSPYDRASAFLLVGDKANALRLLEQAYVDRDWWITWVAIEPRWDSVRSEPRFKKLVAGTQASKVVGSSAVDITRATANRKRRVAAAALCALLVIVCYLAWLWYSRP